MALRIRLARAGATKRPHYRVVVADSRHPRDGRFLEKLGTYSPLLPKDSPDRVRLDAERIKFWLDRGATPSERAARVLGAAEIIPMPPWRERPVKGRPKAKAQERLEAARAAAAQPAAETALEAAEPEPAAEAEAEAPEAAEPPADDGAAAEGEAGDKPA